LHFCVFVEDFLHGVRLFLDALLVVPGADDEEATALTLARKKLAATGPLPWEVRRRRTAAVLGRKGYSREVTMRAIAKALAEE